MKWLYGYYAWVQVHFPTFPWHVQNTWYSTVPPNRTPCIIQTTEDRKLRNLRHSASQPSIATFSSAFASISSYALRPPAQTRPVRRDRPPLPSALAASSRNACSGLPASARSPCVARLGALVASLTTAVLPPPPPRPARGNPFAPEGAHPPPAGSRPPLLALRADQA